MLDVFEKIGLLLPVYLFRQEKNTHLEVRRGAGAMSPRRNGLSGQMLSQRGHGSRDCLQKRRNPESLSAGRAARLRRPCGCANTELFGQVGNLTCPFCIYSAQAGGAQYDFATVDKPMYDGYYQPEFGLDLKEVPLRDEEDKDLNSYFVFSKDDTQLAADVNAALEEVVQDGTSKQINEKYFGGDYSPNYAD